MDSAKGWSLLVLYIFLPAANLALVRIFKCYDMPDGTSWLTADMSLQCTHKGGAMLTNHALMVTYASAALIFWGPAVIYLFWRLLVNHHDMIVNYDKEQAWNAHNCAPKQFFLPPGALRRVQECLGASPSWAASR